MEKRTLTIVGWLCAFVDALSVYSLRDAGFALFLRCSLLRRNTAANGGAIMNGGGRVQFASADLVDMVDNVSEDSVRRRSQKNVLLQMHVVCRTSREYGKHTLVPINLRYNRYRQFWSFSKQYIQIPKRNKFNNKGSGRLQWWFNISFVYSVRAKVSVMPLKQAQG